MRIPTSVIAMSLLTAAPFGLAIRDTLNNKPTAADDGMYDVDAAEQKRLAEYEAQAAREAEEAAARDRAKLAKIDTVFGSERASIGSFLAGVQIGAPDGDALQAKLDGVDAGFAMTSPELTNGHLSSLVVRITDTTNPVDGASACDVLDAKLTAAWGPSVGGAWINPATHQRASVEEGMCVLTFSSYLEPAEWASRVPTNLLGKSNDKLLETAGPNADDVYEDEIDYSFAGTGYGTEHTLVRGFVSGDKIVGFTLESDTDFDTLVAIRDAISKSRSEQPTRDEDAAAWLWKKKPQLSLTQDAGGNQFVLRVGKPPSE